MSPLPFATCVSGSPMAMVLDTLAPGVVGYAIEEQDGTVYIPLINATQEGSGAVGRFLDTLPKDREFVIPNVVSARLDGMLRRRGWKTRIETAEDWDMEVFYRAKA